MRCNSVHLSRLKAAYLSVVWISWLVLVMVCNAAFTSSCRLSHSLGSQPRTVQVFRSAALAFNTSVVLVAWYQISWVEMIFPP